jgi:hypothetical protein
MERIDIEFRTRVLKTMVEFLIATHDEEKHKLIKQRVERAADELEKDIIELSKATVVSDIV